MTTPKRDELLSEIRALENVVFVCFGRFDETPVEQECQIIDFRGR